MIHSNQKTLDKAHKRHSNKDSLDVNNWVHFVLISFLSMVLWTITEMKLTHCLHNISCMFCVPTVALCTILLKYTACLSQIIWNLLFHIFKRICHRHNVACLKEECAKMYYPHVVAEDSMRGIQELNLVKHSILVWCNYLKFFLGGWILFKKIIFIYF